MSLVRKIKRALRGEVPWRVAVLEAGRRTYTARERRRERALLARARDAEDAARLQAQFAQMSARDLLAHFRVREFPKFLYGFDLPASELAQWQQQLFPAETKQLLADARRIVQEHAWPVLGYGVRQFGVEIDWLRDPVAGTRWPLVYHGDVNLFRDDGSDARVLWEVNRLPHLITLGRAYIVSGDETFATEFFSQVHSWRAQNPVGLGVNWSCAMEVALRALNLLAAFQLFRRSQQLNEARLAMLLAMFDEHGAHIRRNLEFSYIATSNHYLSDVVGLLWLGVCLPELAAARAWREFALRELLREMDKQVLADGANAEASTGYHRLTLELFLYTFILCRANNIEIKELYWHKLRTMLEYVRAYLRPDGHAPLIGDTDSGQIIPIARRAADEHANVLSIGAALFVESRFKLDARPTEELLWTLDSEGCETFEKLTIDAPPSSAAFADAGTYIMREGDLYLLFNASGAGIGGRGSHGHNDALSIEVSACGASLIADPGTYVYTSDLRARHLFRSTAYHSTVEVDGAEQNTVNEQMPFIIGDEAHPRVLRWASKADEDVLIAEHQGYRRLASGAIIHQRAVTFDKRQGLWRITDTLEGTGAHLFRFFFHFAPGTQASVRSAQIVEVCDKMTGARLLICPLNLQETATLEPRWSSRDYGEKRESQAACWTIGAHAPLVVRWVLVPVCAGEEEAERLSLIAPLK